MSAAKKTAKATEPEILGWDEANAVLHALGVLDLEIAHDQGELALAITKLKADYEAHIDAALAHRKQLVVALERFTEAHKTDLDGKSRQLTHGTVGYRKQPPSIKLTWKIERILQALRLRKLTDCIRTIEEPNKDALLLLDKDTLKTVGCKKAGGQDKFYAEPDLADIKERP